MAAGTIKKLTDKGFGFIKTDGDKDLFFHSKSLVGVEFDELQEGQKVTYTAGSGPKGPCAENVKLAEEKLEMSHRRDGKEFRRL